MADSFTNKYLERKRQLTGNSTVTKRTTVPSKSTSSNNHAEGEAVSSSAQGRSSGTSGSSRSGSSDSFTSGYLRRKQELSRPSIAQIDPFDLPQFDSSILPDVSTPNKKASQTIPSRVQQAIQERNYSPLDRANDIIQGALRQWAGGIGSAVGNVLDRTTSRYNSDAADQWLDLVQDSMENRDDKSYFDRPEVQDRLENIQKAREQTAPFVQEIYEIAEETGRQGTEQVERAKADLGPVGSFAVDVGTQVPQMLADAAFGAVTGGSALLPLGVRSYGYGVQEAMGNGADRDQAAMYGVASGAKEALTEKLFSVALPFSRIYGGGSFDDAIQRGIQTAVERFASTPTGQRIVGGGLSLGASALTEGAEEFISDWLGWQLPRIYGGDVATAEETLSDSLYDFLVGAAVGGLGGVVSPETYNYQLPGRQGNTGDVVNSDTTTAVGVRESQANSQNTVQNDNIPEATRQAVEMLSRGEEISGNQATRIARDPEALSLLRELTGQEINTDAPISQVRSDIRAVAGARAASGGVSSQEPVNTQTGQKTTDTGHQTERTAAQRAYDVDRVRGAASSTGMGENGQRAISAAYDGSVDADRYYAGFTAYYEAGLSGRAQEQVRSDYAADLTEAQKFAAYAAGHNDAAASLQREKLAAQFAQTAGEDSGLVYDDFVREAVESGRTVSGEKGSGPAYLTQETAERVNSVAKALGLRVRFVDQVDGGRANAEIAGSEVQIEKNNPLPVQFLMGHEVTHRLQELAPEEYRAFREAAAQDEMVQTYVRRYAEGDSGLTYEQALDEAAADYAGRMLEDGALLDQFIGRSQDNRTLLEKIRDAVRTLVRRLTGAEKRAAQTAEGKLSAALKAGARRAETLQERQGDGTMDTTRNSLKEDGEYGRTREETGAEFERRCLEEGYQVLAGADTRYGYRGVRSAGEAARQVQTELERLGVPCFVKEGAVLKNNGTTTVVLKSPQATTLSVGRIAIDNSITLPPKNVAGHEAFHFWKGLDGRESYTETVLENLDFTSEAFQKYQSSISRVMFQGEVDLSNQGQFDQLMEEILAYLSGDIHEGTNEDALRPMFRDFDAVRTAWENLVEENRGGTTRSRYSLKEDRDHGRAREETREEFRRRCLEEGYQFLEKAGVGYGFRRAGQPDDGGTGEQTSRGAQTQQEMTLLGIPADVIDGPVLRNRNGFTDMREVEQAVTVARSHVFISKNTTLSPRNIAGHEAFHLWKSGTGRDTYIETLEDNLQFSSEAFREYQSDIALTIFGQEADLTSPENTDKLFEELFAYISGDIHEGANEANLRPMFRDFDAVRAAWENLVEENQSTQARESRKGFSVDRELDREIRQIVKEAREGGRSEEAVQADIRALVQESYQRMAEQYGTIPTGERPAREARVPRRTAENRVVSQTVRTVLEAGATPEAAIPNIEELTARGVFSYTRYTDKQAMEDAEGVIRDKGYATALSDWTSRVRSGEVSKTNTAEGWALYNQAANSGDVKSAMTILTNMVEHQRNAAQAVQATRILKQLSPDAQLYGVERSVRNLQEELTRKYGKNAPDLKIDEELAGRFLSARTQKTRDEAIQELYRDIGRQMPSRFVDKWNAWRYLAMLGNPRTHVRNVVGNAFFAPVVATKNLTATAIEAAAARVSRGKMGRSKRLVGFGRKDRTLLSAAWADFANVEEQILGSGKYSDSANANRYIQEGRVIFRNKALETARRGNSAALDLEDTWFSKPHYAYALAQYAKANGLTAAQLRNGRGLDGARAYAIREAQKATYRDTNAFSQMISGLGRYQGSNPAKKAASVVLEGILPFRKTPANILVRGVEYSPLGLLKSLTYDLVQVRAGEKTAAEAIDGIAAGLTGTGLVALGVLLAAEGLVRGSGGGDDDENQYEELMGHQAYALEVGGQSYTLDWLAPEALPFFVGVNLWEQSGAEEEAPTLSTMINAIGNVTEPLLEMSCLQSLNEVFDAVGYATSEGLGELPSALVSSATSYFTQAFPTILGQAERTSQGERMTTYTEKNAFLTQDMQYTLGSISGRVPGWDYQQIPYIDAWGRTESTGSTAARAFDNFLNPAYRSTIEESPIELALKKLYEQTGEGAVLPSRAPRYFNVDGVRKDLTAEEYVEYATARGQTAYVLMEELFQRTDGAGLSDEDMVNAVERVYEYANAQAKSQVSSYEPDGWVKKAMDGAASGVSPVDYTLYELAKEMADAENSDLEKRNGSIDQSEAEAAIDMLTGLSDEARAYLWQSTNKGWSEKNNPYR